MSENNDKSSNAKTPIEEGFYVLRFQNDTNEITREVREINSNFIQFHFCIKGHGDFLFNSGNYVFNVQEEHSILLYNPQRDLPIDLKLQPNTWIVGVVISIKKFHSLFSHYRISIRKCGLTCFHNCIVHLYAKCFIHHGNTPDT